MIGVTPMIGLNDVTTETFDLNAASELLAFAERPDALEVLTISATFSA